MFNRDFRPRLDLGRMQTNVIMTQIRAEKQKTSIKLVEPILMPKKQRPCRKHFPRDLTTITDITNHNLINQESRSPTRSTGKKILRKSVSLNHLQCQKSGGKRKFEPYNLKSTFNPLKINCKRRNYQIPKSPFGRKRLDLSPVFQQKESSNSPLHWGRNNIF